MPIIKEVEIWWSKLSPNHPNTKVAGQTVNPRWELQMRTSNKDTKKELESYGFKVTTEEDEVNGGLYYRANIQKNTHSKDGNENQPVEVVDRKMQPVDPRSIGNGSLGNVRFMAPKDSKAKILLGVQILKLVRYESQNSDGFETYDDAEEEESFSEETSSATPTPPSRRPAAAF
jgi:hypothetical protein